MNKLLILIFIFIFISVETFGQTVTKYSIQMDSLEKIDMQVIKNQSYLKFSKQINCKTTSNSTIEDRVCANLELQKQDSLLQSELKTLITEMGSDTTTIKKITLSQEIWEKYRYAQCNSCVIDDNAFNMINFMKCASKITAKRREDIKLTFHY